MNQSSEEMSVEVKVTYVRPPLPTTYGGWLCHRCHKEMEERDTPNHEWHICDKCMRYEGTKPLYTQQAMVIYSKEVTKNEKQSTKGE